MLSSPQKRWDWSGGIEVALGGRKAVVRQKNRWVGTAEGERQRRSWAGIEQVLSQLLLPETDLSARVWSKVKDTSEHMQSTFVLLLSKPGLPPCEQEGGAWGNWLSTGSQADWNPLGHVPLWTDFHH